MFNFVVKFYAFDSDSVSIGNELFFHNYLKVIWISQKKKKKIFLHMCALHFYTFEFCTNSNLHHYTRLYSRYTKFAQLNFRPSYVTSWEICINDKVLY